MIGNAKIFHDSKPMYGRTIFCQILLAKYDGDWRNWRSDMKALHWRGCQSCRCSLDRRTTSMLCRTSRWIILLSHLSRIKLLSSCSLAGMIFPPICLTTKFGETKLLTRHSIEKGNFELFYSSRSEGIILPVRFCILQSVISQLVGMCFFAIQSNRTANIWQELWMC